MSYSGIFVSMPVMKVESVRDDDEHSRRQRQKQLERQLPHMRIADKNRSEKILADAMRTGGGKNSAQHPSELPQPSTARSPQRLVNVGQSLNERVGNETPGSEVHELKAEDRSLMSQDLHDLEERLQGRKNPPSASEILSILKKMEAEVQNQNKTEREAMTKAAEQADLLCSLNFIEGYVGALANPRETRAAIAEVMESLRGKITMPHAEPVSAIEWQQENILQLSSDTDAKCTLKHDAAGHTQVVVEVNEEALQAKSQSLGATEPNKNKLVRAPAVRDDTLPLVVQRSV